MTSIPPIGKSSGHALLAADVHALLRNRIISLEIKQGSRLVEDEISREINVGRTPVREALLRLEGEGLVSRQRRGWLIEATNPANARFIFETRISTESYATRLAAQRGSSQQKKRLISLMSKMDNYKEISRAELNRLDRTFHETIVAMAANPLLAEMHERTQFHYWNLRLPIFFNEEQTVASNAQHRSIFEALESGDPEAAEKAARDHIETTSNIVREALESM
ncbi:GntR family transcriptional regulator [Pelagibacterium halotolerans]|uniref:Transcriptional regulator, GntR family n=1 Tax=Pelagibacterium halotolerans (strain DSM 22347 / JCM 15775 / CGMCC 1.7692 / B2) TaxID=1082931 RepID=G4R8C3_PELHB|nr:GntR family transcriptional regulator [Pelagibacterium halotolerans]AEQ52367.1 transcriptional regulator, GntR family [Pelagibacterium halotolerans B2]QJR17894.1 GntR family transcriptional regulator [Pelagibacterium halotolerans]SEA34477.1 DNA-binding transcriptional regulator, GntR family [Pelagibacterium halotolerans]